MHMRIGDNTNRVVGQPPFLYVDAAAGQKVCRVEDELRPRHKILQSFSAEAKMLVFTHPGLAEGPYSKTASSSDNTSRAG